MANPYYLPDLDSLQNNEDEFMISLIYNEEYIDSLSNKGLQVWYYSDFKDFLNTLKPYTSKSNDLRLLYNSFVKKSTMWRGAKQLKKPFIFFRK